MVLMALDEGVCGGDMGVWDVAKALQVQAADELSALKQVFCACVYVNVL